ncbi:MAG: TonB-dependent receptor [Flavisolibacter sp.]
MRIWMLLAALITYSSIYSQTIISGSVNDNKNKPLQGASITLKDTYDGATTDSTGRFSFKTTEKGDHIILASAIGYKGFEQKISLSGQSITLSINLKEEINELKAVVITAGSFEAGDRKKGTVLSTLDILTTASANADVTAAIKTLPGAQQVGESEGLFVRGGTATETKIFIDGTLVNNFFYSTVPDIAQRGRFSPFIFKGTVFSAGGYSALYGQALSSALILESIDLPEVSSASLSISPIGGGGGIQKLSKNKNWSWGASYNYLNVDLAFKVLKPSIDYFTMPDFHTGDFNFRVKTSKTGMLKYYGYFSANKVGIRRPSVDTPQFKDAFELNNFNMYHNLSWKETIGKGWKVNAGLSYSNNIDHINGNLQDLNNNTVVLNTYEYKNFALRTRDHYFNSKVVIEKRFLGLNTVRFGAEYNNSDEHYYYTINGGQQIDYGIIENLKAAFAETDVYITNNLAAKIGGRFEHSSLLNQANIAPRISIAYKLGKESQASIAYGKFFQDPETKYLPSANPLSFMEAEHYIAQYQKMSNGIIFRIEAYYKKYHELLKTTLTQYNQQEANSNNGYGDAKGFELFWRDKKTFKNFDYWISYSYLDTKRNYLNFPYAIQPNFASTHTASIVLKKFVASIKTQINASYTYASPRPYYNIVYDNGSGKFIIFDQGKTLSYNSLSLSIDYLPNVFKSTPGRSTVFVFSINNVLGSKQVFGYNYSRNGLYKYAITPSVKSFVYIGAFFSFGVDRSQEAINNNL